jgi:hypothetical protein
MQAYSRQRLMDFWSHVQLPDGCWVWGAATFDTGYGMFSAGEKTVRTHRYVWEAIYGPIPDGLDVCHHCDNPPCVRPDHLFLGTDQTNTDDKVAKRRHGFGENHPGAKLSDAQVAEIRARRAAGERPYKLAKEFGVTYVHIWTLCTGRQRK